MVFTPKKLKRKKVCFAFSKVKKFFSFFQKKKRVKTVKKFLEKN